MNKNFEDYLKAILEHYEVVKNGKDADFLEKPTPGNLKKLCLQLLEKGLNNADEQTFMNFFFPKEGQTLQGLIRTMNADGLRTPSDFLKTKQGLTNNRPHANLVAVLIGFEPRPFIKFQDIINDEKEEIQQREVLIEEKSANLKEEVLQETAAFIENEKIEIPKEEISTERIKEEFPESETSQNFSNQSFLIPAEKDKGNGQNQNTGNGGIKKSLIALSIILFVSLSVFFIHKSTEPKCMIWKEDHYEMIDCEQKGGLGFLSFEKIRPYNEELFEKQQKIIPTDTTTFFNGEEALLHYAKRNNECEFFTMPGKHPTTGKDLRPVTRLIIQKYALGWKEN